MANAAVDAFVIEDADVKVMDSLDEHLVTGTPCGSDCGSDNADDDRLGSYQLRVGEIRSVGLIISIYLAFHLYMPAAWGKYSQKYGKGLLRFWK